MFKKITPQFPLSQWARRASSSTQSTPLIQIQDGTFYSRYPSEKQTADQAHANKALFENLTLTIPSSSSPTEHWAILSPSSFTRTTFLQVLRGQLVCLPPTARTYPYLNTEEISLRNPRFKFPEKAIEYVGFDNEKKSYGGAYLSARYESRVEKGDFTLEEYFVGITGFNVSEEERRERTPDQAVMLNVAEELELLKLFEKPVSTLSNGQSRRARIGKALLTNPEMLLLDAPFIGLDPYVTENISRLLHRLSNAQSPRIFISLRPQDMIPPWVTHLVYAGADTKVNCVGSKRDVFKYFQNQHAAAEAHSKNTTTSADATLEANLLEVREVGRQLSEKGDFDQKSHQNLRNMSLDGFPSADCSQPSMQECVVEMDGVNIKYGTNPVLGDWTQTENDKTTGGLRWKVKRGERWGVFGANGSGKTTLLSLITSDHPQTYSAPVKLFGRSRLPSPGERGISIFDIQARIGHASPEIHGLFPKRLSVQASLESAFADTPIAKPIMNATAHARVKACLKWFAQELNPNFQSGDTEARVEDSLKWAEQLIFSDLSFSSQRVLLFLRAIVRHRDIVILDEAFSGMDDLARDKCLLFLSHGENMTLLYDHKGDSGPVPVASKIARDGRTQLNGLGDDQALLCVSHSKLDVPGCIREWICLPEPGTGPPRVGRLNGPVELDARRWDEIWGRNR